MHPAPDRLADYWAGLLDGPDADDLESHLFECAACARECERLAGLAVAMHHAVAPALSAARFAALADEGRVADVNPMLPGGLATVFYPEAGKVLVHRLGGADLARARRVDVDLLGLDGTLLLHLDDVPFDAARGEVLVACQRHFADLFPRDGVFRLQAVLDDRREEAARYTVLHRLRG